MTADSRAAAPGTGQPTATTAAAGAGVRSGGAAVGGPAGASAEPNPHELVALLQDDRQWLLRQLDQGHWPQWRLDLAALERELGQLLDRLDDRLGPS